MLDKNVTFRSHFRGKKLLELRSRMLERGHLIMRKSLTLMKALTGSVLSYLLSIPMYRVLPFYSSGDYS